MPLLVIAANDIDTPGCALEAELPSAWLELELAEAEARAAKPGSIKARLSRSGKADVVVRGRIHADVEVPCARCLGPTTIAVDTELSLLLKPKPGGPPAKAAATAAKAAAKSGAKAAAAAAGAAASPEKTAAANKRAAASRRATQAAAAAPKNRPVTEYEFAAEEADLDEYDGERVVLDAFVREAILLELPSFPLCSETCDGGEQTAELARLRAKVLAEEAAQKKSPFEALRHLMDDSPLPSDDALGNEGGSSAAGQPQGRRASAAEVRRATRVQSRGKPKIRSSIVGHRKK